MNRKSFTKLSDKFKLLLITTFIGLLLMIVKFLAFYFTNSIAILTDALESIVNLVAGSFALYSIWLSERPKDDEHPYGHGKIEFISVGLEGLFICLACIFMIYKAIESLINPSYPIHTISLGMLLSLIAGLVNYLMGNILIKKGKSKKSMTLMADGKHLVSDAYSSMALIIGLLLILLTNIYWLDSLIAIIFAVYIGYHGFELLRIFFKGVMDEADTQLLEQVVNILKIGRQDNWIDIHNLRIIQYGAKLHIDCHVTLPFYYNLNQGHDEVDNIENLINSQIPDTEIFIHLDPCTPPDNCSICSIKDCKLRESAYLKKIEWNTTNVQHNKKHHKSD